MPTQLTDTAPTRFRKIRGLHFTEVVPKTFSTEPGLFLAGYTISGLARDLRLRDTALLKNTPLFRSGCGSDWGERYGVAQLT